MSTRLGRAIARNRRRRTGIGASLAVVAVLGAAIGIGDAVGRGGPASEQSPGVAPFQTSTVTVGASGVAEVMIPSRNADGILEFPTIATVQIAHQRIRPTIPLNRRPFAYAVMRWLRQRPLSLLRQPDETARHGREFVVPGCHKALAPAR